MIIYHAEFLINGHKLLPGGFFGVDVFFVISGFLINTLMIEEFSKTGAISISHFYQRRARRLLPALLVVIIASMPLAWLHLLPSQLIDYAKSIIASLSFGSNFYWNYSLQAYGVESGLFKPFLHTWSLAVEEQYYIVFPIIILSIYKWCKSYTITLLTAGILLSLSFAQWMTSENASFSFYMLPSRLWEMLAGALLANILHQYPQKENNCLLKKAMPTAGLFLIAYSFLFIEFDSGHPGLVTLLPVIGSMLLIGFANKQELVTKALASKYFVSIGLISYSLYLWHYPIFSFFRLDGLFDTDIGRVVAIILTYLLSIATVKFIEKPFRNKTLLPNKIFYYLLVLFTATIVGLCVIAINKDGFENRFKLISGFINYQKGSKEPGIPFWEIEMDLDKKPFNVSKTKVLIVGNSHGSDTLKAFYTNPQLYGDYDFRKGSAEQIRCFDKKNPDNFEHSNNFFLSDHYKKSQIILISTQYSRGKCQKGQSDRNLISTDLKALPYLIEQSLLDGKKVIIFGNTTRFKDISGNRLFWNDHHKNTIIDSIFDTLEKEGKLSTIANDEILSNKLKLEINTQYFKLKNRKKNINKRVKAIADKFNVPYVDKYDFVCEEIDSICFGITPNGHKAFPDYGHWTLEGAKFFGTRMAQKGVLELLDQQSIAK